MKVLHLVSSDSLGGASKACLRIHNALLQNKVDSKLLVLDKNSEIDRVYSVYNSKTGNYCKKYLYYKNRFEIKRIAVESRGMFSLGRTGIDISKDSLVLEADVLNFHWINNGFLSLKSLDKLASLNKPIVWTLHDMWAFTGGCHYSGNCRKYESGCGNCPILKESNPYDVSSEIIKNKQEIYGKLNITAAACSTWLRDIAKNSELFKNKDVINIPNPIETDIYKPLDKNKSKEKFSLDKKKKILLFAAMSINEKRKGFFKLKETLDYLSVKHPDSKKNIQLLIMGKPDESLLNGLDFDYQTTGMLRDDKIIAEAYNAADLFIMPSLEDNLPNTVMESLACGTPVIAFNIGGIPDMVENGINGALIDNYSIEDFGDNIYSLIKTEAAEELGKNGRDKITKFFSYKVIGGKYLSLYHDLIK